MKKEQLDFNVRISGVDDATAKAMLLCETLEKAKSIASDLADSLKGLTIEIES